METVFKDIYAKNMREAVRERLLYKKRKPAGFTGENGIKKEGETVRVLPPPVSFASFHRTITKNITKSIGKVNVLIRG